MDDRTHFHGISFDSDFRHAVRDDGLTVRLSRLERLATQALVRRPGAVLTRDGLLDALTGPGSDAADRNIDLLITRLRRKLGDPARSPIYIATHYGEGYSWIAPRVSDRQVADGAFLVVGPLRGVDRIGDFAGQAETFSRELQLALDQRTAKDCRVVLDPACPRADAFRNEAPEYAVDLNFVTLESHLDCIVTLKVFRTNLVVRITRERLTTAADAQRRPLNETGRSLAGQLAQALWESSVIQQSSSELPGVEPLTVRFKRAALMLTEQDGVRSGDAPSSFPEYERRALGDSMRGFLEAQQRLRGILELDPDNPVAMLMLAACIRSKYVATGPMAYLGPDTRTEDEDEMERLVTTSLPHLQADPLSCLTAAQVLFFIDRGYRRLAVQIAEEAFRSTTALTESLIIVGWMRMFLGEIEQATELFGQAQDLSGTGSYHSTLYLFILRCVAFLAGGDRDALDRELECFFDFDPPSRTYLGLLFGPADSEKILPEAKALLLQMDEATARATLLSVNYGFCRLFSFPDHRENVIRTPHTLLTQRFGYDFVPEEVRRTVPGLFHSS